NSSIELMEGDILDISTVITAMRGIDALCHLGAIVGDPACNLDFENTLATNYLSTLMIAECCKYFQINRIIFASTCSVYGASQGTELLTENSPLNPVSTYARTKLDAESMILKMMDGNFSPVIFRKATVYGLSPRMRFDLVINTMAAKAFFDGKVTVNGGDQWRPFVHVEDVARAYICALRAPLDKIRGKIFNVGSTSENYQIMDIAKIIKELLPSIEIEIKDDVVDKRNYMADCERIKRELSFQSRWVVKEGVRAMIKSFEQGKYADRDDAKYSNYLTFKGIYKNGSK
nr:SDR family oxidoreductase [Candidatus Sigynarchaeota archaeon]